MSGGVAYILLWAWDPLENFSSCYIGGVLIAVAFVNAGIEFYELTKVAAIIESFSALIPYQTHCVRDGTLQNIHASDVVVGDVVNVKMGDKVPADAVVVWANEFQVDNSSLTGESEAQERCPVLAGAAADVGAMAAKNVVFGGTSVVHGEAFAVVIRTGSRTVMGQVSRLTRGEKRKRSPLSSEIRLFCRTISFLATATSATFFIASLARGAGFSAAFQFAVGMLVAWIPQGLPLTVTMLLAVAGGRMAEKKVLVKDLHGVETLGAITLLASDKTGTLTMNEMKVARVWTNLSTMFAGDGKPPKGEKPLNLSTSGVSNLLHICATCTRAKFESNVGKPVDRNIVGDATDKGLLKFAAAKLVNVDKLTAQFPKVFEVPFTSDTKTHLTIHRKPHADGGLTLHVKGAPERVLASCGTILIQGKPVPLADVHREQYREAHNRMAARGERVLAFAMLLLPGRKFPENFRFSLEKRNFPTSGLTLVGLISMEDPPKRGVRRAIGQIRQAGIKVVMITGDHPITAAAVARRINLLTFPTRAEEESAAAESPAASSGARRRATIVDGERLSGMGAAEWAAVFEHEEIIFARTSPKQKLEIVTRAQELGHIVGVTGDGVNDAAALKKADLGIAMNRTGSDVSKEAAGMILLDDDFTSTVVGILEGSSRCSLGFLECITYFLTHILAEIFPYLLNVVVPLPLTLTAIQILAVDLGFELFITLSFAWEPPEDADALLRLGPRRPVTAASVAAAMRRREAAAAAAEATATAAGGRGGGGGGDDDSAGFLLELDEAGSESDAGSPGVRKSADRLVDAEVLSWAYLEGGVMEAGIALGTFFLVMWAGFGITPTDAKRIQRMRSGFKPHAPSVVLQSGETISGEMQLEALQQAQSAFYLSILAVQLWNLFACKQRLRLRLHRGLFVANRSTLIAVFCGVAFATLIVYTPLTNALFLTSMGLDPTFLLIPLASGSLLFAYSVARRAVLRRYWPHELGVEVELPSDMQPAKLNMAVGSEENLLLPPAQSSNAGGGGGSTTSKTKKV
ncbi:E1-E2 ATPase-domain-containing protein [Zopfochytrium polystomum]|nr:E1-E2 ATPase-domain-containing protein [Zopfochytrium polystomum]